MAKTPEYGFECGQFSVALSAEKIVIPSSKGTIKKSMLPMAALDDVAGPYELTVRCGDSTIYKAVVHVLWLRHRQEARRSRGLTGRKKKQPQPFLGFRCEDAEEVANALKAYAGKHVSLRFELVG